MKQLVRSKSDRKLAGVLGGLAKYLGIDSTLLRVIFIIVMFPSGVFPLVITYFVLVFLMQNEENGIQ